ncbi:MAG: hypothetical protein ABH859_02755 [Pseudomonadota bacterium]
MGKISPIMGLSSAARLDQTTADFHSFIDEKANGLRERDNPQIIGRLNNIISGSNPIRERPSSIINQLEANTVAAESTYNEARERIQQFRRQNRSQIQAAEAEYNEALTRARRNAHSGRGQSFVPRPPILDHLDRAEFNVSRLGRLARSMRTNFERLGEALQSILDDDDNGPNSSGTSGGREGNIQGSSGVNGHGVSFMTRLRNLNPNGAVSYFRSRSINFGRGVVNYFFTAEALALAYARTVAWPWLQANASVYGPRIISSATNAARVAGTMLESGLGMAQGFVRGAATVSFPVIIPGALIDAILNENQNDPYGPIA